MRSTSTASRSACRSCCAPDRSPSPGRPPTTRRCTTSRRACCCWRTTPRPSSPTSASLASNSCAFDESSFMAAWSERQAIAQVWIDARPRPIAALSTRSAVCKRAFLSLRARREAALPVLEAEVEKELVLERPVAPPRAEKSHARPAVAHTTDVAIIGGGLAGSLAAAMLGRAGIDAVLIDPRPEYPPDFRCEKLDGDQVTLLKKTGLADGRAARLDAGRGVLGRALRAADRKAAGRPAGHFLRAAGQHRASANSARNRASSRPRPPR